MEGSTGVRVLRIIGLLFFMTSSAICFCMFPVQARVHNHTKHMKHHHDHRHISMPPTASPPSLAPESPGDDSGFVYDVRSFGAMGDSVTDDTQAFKLAWEEARVVESATLLVPRGYSFMIQSTIFLGPCANNFTFQVNN